MRLVSADPSTTNHVDELSSAVAAELVVSKESDVVRMVEMAVESFGGLDILHNNATDAKTNAADTDIVTLDMDLFDRIVAVNLEGVVMGCKHAIPHMLARGGGVRPVYRASKAGLASDESGFVNGTTLMVEGGVTIFMPSTQFTMWRQ